MLLILVQKSTYNLVHVINFIFHYKYYSNLCAKKISLLPLLLPIIPHQNYGQPFPKLLQYRHSQKARSKKRVFKYNYVIN